MRHSHDERLSPSPSPLPGSPPRLGSESSVVVSPLPLVPDNSSSRTSVATQAAFSFDFGSFSSRLGETEASPRPDSPTRDIAQQSSEPAPNCDTEQFWCFAENLTNSAPLLSEALRNDLLALHAKHEDELSDLIFHLDDGQAVLANSAIVEARLSALLCAAEPLDETEPAMLDDDTDNSPRSRAGLLKQVRLRNISRSTLDALLRWGYGEQIPKVGNALVLKLGEHELHLEAAFELFEACVSFDLERFLVLLREALLESLDVEHFADVLRESHVRQIPSLKQGCMRFALHHFDELVDRPHVFIGKLQEIPEVVSDLFRLGRQWKDEVFDRSQHNRSFGAMESPRPAPAPPSSFVADMERLFNSSRLAEERGKSERDRDCEDPEGSRGSRDGGRQELAPDCRIVVGEDIFLGHSAILAARSDFFLAAFTSKMVERSSLLVTLQHMRGAMPRRDSVLALLYFLYTGKTDRVTANNAIEVLSLVGGEQNGDEFDQGGYLQLHDAATLRGACEELLMSAVAKDEDAFLPLLVQAHELGASRLKKKAIGIAVHHFKDLAISGAFQSLPMPLLSEVLKHFAIEYDYLLPCAAKGLHWELSLLPAPDGRFENTYEAVSSSDLSRGAGASGTTGCSEASLVATFDRQVRVRRLRIGVDLRIGDFDATHLNGSKLQYLTASGSWQDAALSVSVQDGVVREFDLPQVLTAKAFRLVRRQRLAVGLLAFE